MKKIILMGATLVAFMASCSEDEVLVDENLNQNAQKVIGFSTFADLATRADETATVKDLEYFHNTFAVYGTKVDADNNVQRVFGGSEDGNAIGTNVEHTATESPNYWNYTPYRYWDKQASYQFIAYAPDTSVMAYNYASGKKIGEGKFVTTAPYVLKGQNLQDGTSAVEKLAGFNLTKAGNDCDLMTSEVINRAKGATELVEFTFKHILAKLNVTLSIPATFASSTVTVKEVKVTNLKDQGIYSSETPVVGVTGWTASQKEATYKLQYVDETGVVLTGTPAYFIESLVMPQEKAGDIYIKYVINTGAYNETYIYKNTLASIFSSVSSFEGASNYTIKFNIDPTENVIKFDAGVTAWDSKNNSKEENIK